METGLPRKRDSQAGAINCPALRLLHGNNGCNFSHMARVSPEQKVAMQSAGTWKEFLHERDELKSSGVGPGDATARALSKYLPKETTTPGDAKETPPSSGNPSQDTPPPGFACLADFEGKDAGEVEIIRWVARYMDIVDVKPSDCPDPAAWSLLSACRRSPAFAASFWQSMYTKIIPSRSQLEAKAPDGSIDGADQVGVIERILVFKCAAEKSRGSSGSAEPPPPGRDGAGSTPAPATNGGASK